MLRLSVAEMFLYQLLVFGALFSASWCTEDWTFPPGFKFGVASSAYQIEGAWNVSDKGEHIWDRFTHTRPEMIMDGANGDVACDSYHLWQTDIENLVKLGVHHYRFSLSWARILPNGFTNKISEDGVRYYNNLIDGLLEKGIEPFLTLYHWDLPVTLQDLGGWTNPLIADWFADYARVAYSLFGDRVKMWLTINEPMIACDIIYNSGAYAPGITSPDHGTFLCNKHILMAHAKAYRIYDEEFRAQYHGEVSLANVLLWFEPWTENDKELTELTIQYLSGRYSHAIYHKDGGWPPAIEKVMEEYSKELGYSKSNLPAFTQEETEFVRGTFDFYALNYYNSFLVRPAGEDDMNEEWSFGEIPALKAVLGYNPDWPETIVPVLKVFPEGLRRQIAWLRKNYGDLKFVITENGYPDTLGLNDQNRIDYIEAHLKQVLLSIKEDGTHLTHYTAWSFMDALEWADGYRTKYGLYEVNFTDPNLTRTPRDSAIFYANLIKKHSLNLK